MKNILITLQDGSVGGTEKRVVVIAKGLCERGYSVAIAIPKNGEIKRYLIEEKLPVDEIPYVRLKRSRNPLYYFYWLVTIPITAFKIMEIINRRNVDVIYTNQMTQLQPAIAAVMSKKKIIWHLIDLHLPLFMDWLFIPVVKMLSDVTVSSCQYRVHQLKERKLSWEGIQILHAPVDTHRFRPRKDRTYLHRVLGIDQKQKIIGMACNINFNKGIEYFLQAAMEILRKTQNTIFIIIGGPIKSQKKYYQDILELRKRLGIEKKVIITGYRDDVHKALACFEILMLSSISEASPLIVLESMACAVPIVANNVGGIPELVIHEENGILVEPKNTAKMAEAVLSILKTPGERERMGKAGRDRVMKEFDKEKVLDRVEKIIDIASIKMAS